jgi:hypothetical protein
LTDIEVQAAADGEADERVQAHVADCASCRAHVEETRRSLDEFGALANQMPAPPADLERRVQQTLRHPHVRRERGATTVRAEEPSRGAWRRHAWTSGLAAAALVVLGVFVVWPSLTKESHLSAAEVLGRSLQTFSTTSGIETFEYDAQLDGLLARGLVPNAGALRVTQVVDHDHPGRFRVSSVDADGTLRSVLAQDPDRGTRVSRFRVDDRMYFFRFTAAPERARTLISLPDLQRAYLRAVVSMMQGMADQTLTTVTDATGTYYAIQLPQTPPDRALENVDARGTTLWDLREAHALIHAGDFHLKELSARGTFLGQPFGLAFTLISHEVGATTPVSASDFTLEPEAGDIVLEGEATNDPAGDVVLTTLRALGQASDMRQTGKAHP